MFNQMGRTLKSMGLAAAVIILAAAAVFPQAKVPAGKTIFRDSDGNLVSNNEFVDIRMANFHYPDATVMRTLEDGTVEFRLQKVPQEGVQAQDFSVRTLDGATVSLGELRGKVVVLNFWFIGCPVCRALKPKLNEFKTRFEKDGDVVFLALTADTEDAVEKFLRKEPFDYVQAADAGPAIKRYSIGGYPKNIVIGRTGEIVYWRSTIKAWDKFESVIRTELAK